MIELSKLSYRDKNNVYMGAIILECTEDKKFKFKLTVSFAEDVVKFFDDEADARNAFNAEVMKYVSSTVVEV